MSSEGLHEARASLSKATLDRHRAIASLMEELEAVDWYDQRVEATDDGELKAILAHNRDEEKEHAAMVLEWLRRRDPRLDGELRTYLMTTGPILEIEEEASREESTGEHASPAATPSDGPRRPIDGSLGIGDLRGDTDDVPKA